MEIQNLQPLTYIIISIIFVFGTGSIFLRLYCRMFLLKTFGWDDMMAIFLLVCTCAFYRFLVFIEN